MIKKIILNMMIVVMALSAVSCSKVRPRIGSASRSQQKLYQQGPEGPKEFRDGWRMGCEVGLTTGSNPFYKTFYSSNKQDGHKYAASTAFQRGWNYAFWYCYRAEKIHQKNGPLGTLFRYVFFGSK